MNFDHIPTRRSPWQSVDVGISIQQKWAPQAWMLTLLIMTPIYLVLRLISIFVFDALSHQEIFGNFFLNIISTPFNAIFDLNNIFMSETQSYFKFCLSNIHIIVLLWLKPIYERISILLYSKKLFGEQLTQKELFKSFMQSLKRGVFLDLTWRRFSFNRHFIAPINLLENQNGITRRNRISNLKNNCSTTIIFSYIAIVGIEISALLSVFAIYLTFSSSTTIDTSLMIVMDIFTLFIFTYLASLSSAIGFSIYINQRNQLEAWDIEKTINKMTISIKEKSKFLIPACLFIFLNLPIEPTYAQSTDDTSHAGSIEQRLKTAQENEKFHLITTSREYKNKPKEEKEREDLSDTFTPSNFSTDGLQIIFLIILALGILIVLYKYKDAIRNFSSIEKKQNPESFDSGLVITKESLPNDIISTVERHFEHNEIRKGISLLYRGALSSLFYDFNIEFERSDTEQSCLERAQILENKELVQFFNELTQVWINLAYGHIEIETEKQTYLLSHWPIYFQNKEAA